VTPEEGGTPRRGFLEWIVAAGSALVGIALAVPALAYLWPATRGGPRRNVLVQGAEALAVGGSISVQVAGRAVLVVRHAAGFRAFSAVCTHLGCLVKWNEARNAFLCPCHAGVYDADGRVVSGPPPAPLPEYEVVLAGKKVYVGARKGSTA